MSKLLFIDCETTGLDPKRNGLIQLAGAIQTPDGGEEFNYLVRPFADDQIDLDALKIQGRTKDQLEAFADPRAIYAQFTKALGRYVDKYDRTDKFHLVAYNGHFDEGFVRQWFLKNGDQYWGSWVWWPYTDLMTIAGFFVGGGRARLPNFRLETVARHFGIEVPDGLHDAMVDVQVTRQLFDRLIRMRKVA